MNFLTLPNLNLLTIFLFFTRQRLFFIYSIEQATYGPPFFILQYLYKQKYAEENNRISIALMRSKGSQMFKKAARLNIPV